MLRLQLRSRIIPRTSSVPEPRSVGPSSCSARTPNKHFRSVASPRLKSTTTKSLLSGCRGTRLCCRRSPDRIRRGNRLPLYRARPSAGRIRFSDSRTSDPIRRKRFFISGCSAARAVVHFGGLNSLKMVLDKGDVFGHQMIVENTVYDLGSCRSRASTAPHEADVLEQTRLLGIWADVGRLADFDTEWEREFRPSEATMARRLCKLRSRFGGWNRLQVGDED